MELWISQMGNPTLLFFALGFLAVLVRSDLEIPDGVKKFLSLYLLLAIGFKGGQELSHGRLAPEHAYALVLGLASSVLLPVLAFFLLRKSFGAATAAAIAASYGSVSAVTFVAAGQFLDFKQLSWDGPMVAVMAAMEAPAIIIGVLLARTYGGESSRVGVGGIFHHALTNGSVLVLVGSFLIGVLSDAKMAEGIKPFTSDLFKGFLSLFLLEMGRVTAQRLKGFLSHGFLASAFALFFPLLSGIGMALLSGLWMEVVGNRFLLAVLAASASYIAVPAAMQKSLPEADQGVYVPMPLGITFPMNLIVGMPIYYALVSAG